MGSVRPDCPRRRARTFDDRGVTIVELLIASTIFVIVLGLATSLFVWQARMNSFAIARSSVQDQVRLTMQLLGNELSLVGQTASFTSTGLVSSIGFEACPQVDAGGTVGLTLTCLELTDEASGPIVRLAYTDSLEGTLSNACRIVSYRMTNNTLQRANKPCFDGNTAVAFNFEEADYIPIIDDVIAFDIELVCSDGTRLVVYPVEASTKCNPKGAYPRAVRFAVLARAGMSAVAPNAYEFRPSWWGASDPALLGRMCEGKEVCFGLAQEFAMPNMSKEK